MIIDGFDTDRKVLVIAEVGNNHEGSCSLAEEMIGAAAEAGADAVKFQTIVPERLVSPQDTRRIAQLSRFRLSYDDFERLADAARRRGVLFLSTPFDTESVAVLEPLVPAFKIASGDNNFAPLLDTVARTGKPILMSCGIATLAELRGSVAAIRQTWRRLSIDGQLALLHCVASYPAPVEEANLLAMRCLIDEFKCDVGYSDHTLGIEAAMLAVAVGARIVEKHFTLDKNHSDFRDHQLSADPMDMAVLVRRIRAIEVLLGREQMVRQRCEEGSAKSLRRSIVASHDLRPGTRLSWRDITWLRPAGGLPPGREAILLGRMLKVPLKAGQMITPDLLDDLRDTEHVADETESEALAHSV